MNNYIIMTHFYERNIVDIKMEYLTYLTDVLVPLIYEGIQSTYNYATEQCNKLDELVQLNPNIKNPGIIKIFQSCLKEIPSLSAIAIEEETKRIKEFSRCSEWFDDLVKAVIKSYIVLLTYNTSGKTCKLVNEKYHEKININEFIHKCYIECSMTFFNNPELFWTGHSKEIIQTCRTMSYKYIKQAIIDAIHKMLPIKAILQEYLQNDYIVEPPKKETLPKIIVSEQSHKEEQEHNVKEFEPPPPENGFKVLEDGASVPTNGILIESEEHDDELSVNDADIKKHLQQIIGTPARDEMIEKHSANLDHPERTNAKHEEEQPTKNEIKEPEIKQEIENIYDTNKFVPKQIPINVNDISATRDADEKDRVLSPHHMDQYFENYFNEK